VKKLRQIHLYLGSFFAPMLILFAVSGLWQVLDRGQYERSPWLRYLSSIHMEHALKSSVHSPISIFLELFVVLMALSLILTITLGVIMAFKFGHGKMTLACLASGIFMPLALILIFGQ
jgi:hypothetical protein